MNRVSSATVGGEGDKQKLQFTNMVPHAKNNGGVKLVAEKTDDAGK